MEIDKRYQNLSSTKAQNEAAPQNLTNRVLVAAQGFRDHCLGYVIDIEKRATKAIAKGCHEAADILNHFEQKVEGNENVTDRVYGLTPKQLDDARKRADEKARETFGPEKKGVQKASSRTLV